MYTLYLAALFFATFLGGGLIWFGWRHRRVVGARPFALLMACVTWWSGCAFLSAVSPDAATAVWLGTPVRFTSVILLTPALLAFALVYVGRSHWLRGWWLAALLFIPAVTLIFNWAGHQWFVYDVDFITSNGVWLRNSWSRGPWFLYVYTPFSYLALLLALFLFWRHARRAQYPYRQQAWLLFTGSLLPIVVSVVMTFDLLAGPDIDLIVLSFIFMGVIYSWALFGYQFLAIMPVARDVVVDNMRDVVIVVDQQDRIVDVNPAFLETMGLTRRQAIGQPLLDLFGRWPDIVARYGQETNLETVVALPLAGGETAYLDMRITPLQRPAQLAGRIIVWRDITQFKKTELALQANLRKVESLYKLGQAISQSLTNPADLLQAFVDNVAAMLPADRVTLIGFDLAAQTITHFIKGGAGQAEVMRPDFAELMAGLSGWVIERQEPALSSKLKPDERESPAVQQRRLGTNCGAIIVIPLPYSDQLLGTMTAINRRDQPDFTWQDVDLMQSMGTQSAVVIENARLYQAEQARIAQLQEMNKALDAFSHTVAHNLKGSLTSVVGYGELVSVFREEGYSDADVTLFGQMIMNAGEKMVAIINSLLLLAQVRKKDDVPFVPLTNMAEIVADVCRRLDWQIKERAAVVETAVAWPVALGYAPWVEEIWANYLSNAIKYGGDPPQVQLGAIALEDGMVRFWVQDNGAGLSIGQQAKLFSAFARVGSRQVAGHGLGLSIVWQIAGRLNGRAGVESEPGAGSRFYFDLPAADDPYNQ